MNDREARAMAPVLGRAVELSCSEGKSLGDAVEQALAERISRVNAFCERDGRPGVTRTEIPDRVVNELLLALFRVVSGGRIPGAPDA